MDLEDDACQICRAISGAADFVVLDEPHLVAFLDREPVSPRHTVVATRQHINYIDEVPPPQARALLAIVDRLRAAIGRQIPTASTGMFLTDGEAAFRDSPHVHVHVFSKQRGAATPPPNATTADRLRAELARVELGELLPPASPGHRSVFWHENWTSA